MKPKENWGTDASGQAVELLSISDGGSCEASILTYGAVLQDLRVPDKRGQVGPITLGLKSLEDYIHHSASMGALVGRVANRIADGLVRFPDGSNTQLEINEAQNHIHGGFQGTGKRNWRLVDHNPRQVTLALYIADRQDAYPGDFEATCTYGFVEANRLRLHVEAQVSAFSPINLAQHSYFNLGNTADVSHHRLQVHADHYTALDAASIPTHTAPVEGTAFDFRKARDLSWQGHSLSVDHNFVFSDQQTQTTQPKEIAVLEAEDTGRRMRLFSTQPCVQVYAGHKLDVPVSGLHAFAYGPFAGLALEPQLMPNGPNQGDPSLFFGPDRLFSMTNDYVFEVF